VKEWSWPADGRAFFSGNPAAGVIDHASGCKPNFLTAHRHFLFRGKNTRKTNYALLNSNRL